MLIAKDSEGGRVEAAPGISASCPTCEESLIAKCGEIKQWHWAHKARTDCDPWSEPESFWHIGWKMLFQPWEREVVIGPHRADISTFGGKIIELQHSAIAPEVIREREEFYGPHMMWVVDSEEFLNNFLFSNKSTYWSFKWRWWRKSWLVARRPLWIDMRDGYLFQPIRIMPNGTGYGNFHNAEEFVRSLGASTNAPLPTLDINNCATCGRNGTVVEFVSEIHTMYCCKFCGLLTRRFYDGRESIGLSVRKAYEGAFE